MSNVAPFVPTKYGPITPSDTAIQPFLALYISTAGNLTVVRDDGQTVTFAVPVGLFVGAGQQLLATGTTAVVGYYMGIG